MGSSPHTSVLLPASPLLEERVIFEFERTIETASASPLAEIAPAFALAALLFDP